MKKQMILDLDTGVDDSIALAYTACHPEIELLGVTGTYGNVKTPVGVQNALDVLSLFNREDVPVYEGESCALNSDSFQRHAVSADIHGENGVGQVSLPRSPRKPEQGSAVDFLIEMMESHGEALSIITTGPLTNIAAVLQKRPDLKAWNGELISMGGALTVRGNVTHFAEANISQDPEAAKLVLESNLNHTVVPLDVTMRSRLTRAHAQSMRNHSRAGGYLAEMLEYYIDHTLGTDETYIHDPSAVIRSIHPEYFTSLCTYLTVETEGIDRGRLIVDHTRLRDASPRTSVCIDVISEKVEQELLRVIELS